MFTTGGTIASVRDEESGLVSPRLDGQTLIKAQRRVASLPPIAVVELSQIPSPAISPETAFSWAKTIIRHLENPTILGAVVVMGTDTLEECAYLFDLLVDGEKPVVITGAMRMASDMDSDGDRNLSDAIGVAAAPAARGKGVLVVMNGKIHAAAFVQKQDPHSLDAFGSPSFAPTGNVAVRADGISLDLSQMKVTRVCIRAPRIEPRVACVKAVLGSDGNEIDDALRRGARGIVVEAFADGGVPPDMGDGIVKAIHLNVPVVIASRTGGFMVPLYTERGDNRWLKDNGAIFANGLSGPKARIKLMLALGDGGAPIDSVFEQ